MVPIPKKRRSGVCKTDEFRGISLVPVAYKAMCSVIQGRLRHVVEERNLVAEEQRGFRKGRGCRDQLLTLVLLGQVKAVAKRGMYKLKETEVEVKCGSQVIPVLLYADDAVILAEDERSMRRGWIPWLNGVVSGQWKLM